MQIPLQITFRHMEHSDALETKIRKKVQKLEQFAEHIMSCRVTIDLEHKHHHQGKLFSVKIDITLPKTEIIADR
ncbi:MAG: 30S ribosomal protein S30, partial [Gammaproteobacteria bacterium]|nr:30S ribosomal protein S30 [Gammaproteobacteria bacterium]